MPIKSYQEQLAAALQTGDWGKLPGGTQPYFSYMEQQAGLPRGYLSQTAQIESKYDPNATSKTGAAGLFQFTKGTGSAYGLSPQERYDPFLNTSAAAGLARDNFKTMSAKLGREPTAGELYLGHQEGASGAASIINAYPTNRVASLSPNVAANITKNGGKMDDQIGQWRDTFLSKFDNSQEYKPSAAGPIGSDQFTGRAPDLTDPETSGIKPIGPTGMPALAPGSMGSMAMDIPALPIERPAVGGSPLDAQQIGAAQDQQAQLMAAALRNVDPDQLEALNAAGATADGLDGYSGAGFSFD